MSFNQKKMRSGIKKGVIAISLAFIGPVCFVLGSGTNEVLTLLNIVGFMLMISCFIIGLIAIKEVVSSFFEKTNE